MKTILAAAAVTVCVCGAAYATGMTTPVMEPEVIMADTSATSADVLMIFAALAVITIILGAASAF